MSDDYPIRPANMDAAREQAVEVLTEHFSRNVMDMDEFEGFLDSVNRCSTTSELLELLSKLPPLGSLGSATDLMPAPGGPPVVVDADRVKPRGFLLGGFEYQPDAPLRTDPNLPTLRVRGLTVLGGVNAKVRLPGETTSRDARRRLRS